MRGIRAVFLAVAAGALAATAEAAVTAEFLPPIDQYGVSSPVGFDSGDGGNSKAGQSFLALTDGALESLRIGNLYHHTPANQAMQALHIAFYDITDSVASNPHPLGAPIAAWDVPASEIPADTYPSSPTFAYSGPTVPIIAGRSYAFVLGTAFGVNVGFNAPYSLGGSFQPYAGGGAVSIFGASAFQSGWDFGFQVNVVVPGPGASMLAGIFGLAALRRRR